MSRKASVRRCPGCRAMCVRHALAMPSNEQCGDSKCLITSCLACDMSYQVLFQRGDNATIRAWTVGHINDLAGQITPGWS